ncbi:MAG: Hsp33 family molecular chaperone HslO, partial [Oscillospiraceae bacterium]|nr:Hsp33 family molecular chaperone HslO [Oscillospiraceae bacterium]
MQDHIIRAISRDGFVKAMAISSTHMVERARMIHKTTPTATAALGRVLTVCSMMGNLQKVENGALTLQFKGGGPLGTILATSDAVGNVRGYVHNPGITLLEKYAGKLDVGAAVGTDGMLTVIRDLQMKEPYIGSVELVTGEIADDITAYFARSEQTPTACALGVLVEVDQSVKVAGGYLIQLLPGAPDDIIDRLEAGIQKAGAVTPMLARGLSPREILEQVMEEFDLEFFETTEVAYRCYCSRERV